MAKKCLMSWRASFGLNCGTSWPAPLTVTNISPSYSIVHPPTYHHYTKYIISIILQFNNKCNKTKKDSNLPVDDSTKESNPSWSSNQVCSKSTLLMSLGFFHQYPHCHFIVQLLRLIVLLHSNYINICNLKNWFT